jgi:hypothetical protein
VPAFHASLLTGLDDDTFTIPHPDRLFFLQDTVDPYDVPVADIPLNAEYGDMLQPPKPNADDHSIRSLNLKRLTINICAEFLVDANGETAPATVLKRARDNDGKPVGTV